MREKVAVVREKNPFSFRENANLSVEKIIKSAREKRILCVKIFRKSDFSKIFHAQNREKPISACKTENCLYVKIFDKVPVKGPGCA